MAVTFTTVRDVEMTVWAAWRGRVLMKDQRTATLVHWPLQGGSCQVTLPRSGARIRVRKSDIVRTYGFVTINGQTYS